MDLISALISDQCKMASARAVLLAAVLLLKETSGWVFNNVDSKELARSLGISEDLENEVDEEMLALSRFNLIFPGTKWCGAGNVADSYDDLGPAWRTDKCCREHDSCPDLIEPGETSHNLTNEAFYTRLSCACDLTFRKCLRKVNSKTSTLIGKMYFNAIGTKCFREDFPVTGCKKKGGWLNSKCLEYEYNTQGQKFYQWFDVPNY